MKKEKPMTKELIVESTITIDAHVSKVWDVLLNPEKAKQYMFGCTLVSDWKVGSPVLWEIIHEGKMIVAVKGTLIKIIPEKHLEYTVFDPNMGIADIAENYLTVTYVLISENGKTVLSVSQGDYSRVEDSENRYNDTVNAWPTVLAKIKELVEAQ